MHRWEEGLTHTTTMSIALRDMGICEEGKGEEQPYDPHDDRPHVMGGWPVVSLHQNSDTQNANH